MNKRIFKPIMSLVLVVVMAVSTMMVSAVSTSATEENVNYKLEFSTQATSNMLDMGNRFDIGYMYLKINGESGQSTLWHDVGFFMNEKNYSVSFSDINVGKIKSVTIKCSEACDECYLNFIRITKNSSTPESVIINGGKWYDFNYNGATLSVDNRAAYVTVKTGDVTYAGTDEDVCIKLIDKNNKSSKEVNLSKIHPKSNAFERDDLASFVIAIPNNFDTVSKINFKLDGECYDEEGSDMYLEYVDVTIDDKISKFSYNKFIIWRKSKVKQQSVTLSSPTTSDAYLYTVTAKTSNKFLAGTDNDVYLHAYDENGNEFAKFELDDNINNFEKDDRDVFYIVSPQKINDIKMKISASSGTDWHLDYVQLDLISSKSILQSTKYKFNQWIKPKNLYAPTSKEVLL